MSELREVAEAINAEEWRRMIDAPRDGTPIRVAVDKKDDLGFSFHEFPYPVCFHEGRWCFARNKAPLFPWQVPKRWRPA